MPRSTPKGILLHGGPPSDSSFRLDEGRKHNIANGVNKTKAETRRDVTAEVCGIHEP